VVGWSSIKERLIFLSFWILLLDSITSQINQPMYTVPYLLVKLDKLVIVIETLTWLTLRSLFVNKTFFSLFQMEECMILACVVLVVYLVLYLAVVAQQVNWNIDWCIKYNNSGSYVVFFFYFFLCDHYFYILQTNLAWPTNWSLPNRIPYACHMNVTQPTATQ